MKRYNIFPKQVIHLITHGGSTLAKRLAYRAFQRNYFIVLIYSGSSQPGAVLPPGGHLDITGDTFGCHN